MPRRCDAQPTSGSPESMTIFEKPPREEALRDLRAMSQEPADGGELVTPRKCLWRFCLAIIQRNLR